MRVQGSARARGFPMTMFRVSLALVTGLAGLAAALEPAGAPAQEVSPAQARVQPVVAMKARPFALGDVRLLDGPFRHAMELDRQYLLSLEPDQLLHAFRAQRRPCPPAGPLGGWEEPKMRGARPFRGTLPLGLRLMFASTATRASRKRATPSWPGSPRARSPAGQRLPQRLPGIVHRPRGAGQPGVGAYYTLHKILAGLLDMDVECGNAQAWQTARQVRRLGRCPQQPAHRAHMQSDARERARRHERGPGEPLRPDGREEVSRDRAEVQPPGPGRTRIEARRQPHWQAREHADPQVRGHGPASTN